MPKKLTPRQAEIVERMSKPPWPSTRDCGLDLSRRASDLATTRAVEAAIPIKRVKRNKGERRGRPHHEIHFVHRDAPEPDLDAIESKRLEDAKRAEQWDRDTYSGSALSLHLADMLHCGQTESRRVDFAARIDGLLQGFAKGH